MQLLTQLHTYRQVEVLVRSFSLGLLLIRVYNQNAHCTHVLKAISNIANSVDSIGYYTV